jgi:hypothetical protein
MFKAIDTIAHLAFFKAKDTAQPVEAALTEFAGRRHEPSISEVKEFLTLYSGGTGSVGVRVAKRAVIGRNYGSHYVDEVSQVLRQYNKKPVSEQTLEQLYTDLCTIKIKEEDYNGYLASFLNCFARRAGFDAALIPTNTFISNSQSS